MNASKNTIEPKKLAIVYIVFFVVIFAVWMFQRPLTHMYWWGGDWVHNVFNGENNVPTHGSPVEDIPDPVESITCALNTESRLITCDGVSEDILHYMNEELIDLRQSSMPNDELVLIAQNVASEVAPSVDSSAMAAPAAGMPSGSMNVVLIASIVFTSIAIIVSIIVLFIALPIFLNSDNEVQAKRAGSIVKTSLGFIIASGTTLVGGFVIQV